MCLSLGCRARVIILFAPLVVGGAALLLYGPIPQDPHYHRFADQRVWAGVPHAGNVLSNAAFLVAGALGLGFLASPRSEKVCRDRRERRPYVLFFAGVFLTAFGSSWYHLEPSNDRLFWDRLPMAIAFLSLFAAVIQERIDPALGSRLLWPLAVIGAASVLFWRATEHSGRGDLRPYALVQYYPAVAIALMLLLYPARYTHSGALWGVAGAYAAAKALELADEPIFRATGLVSGHTLKHIAAGVAAGLVLWMLSRRRRIDQEDFQEDR